MSDMLRNLWQYGPSNDRSNERKAVGNIGDESCVDKLDGCDMDGKVTSEGFGGQAHYLTTNPQPDARNQLIH